MSRRALLAVVIGGAALVVAALVGVVMATSGSSSDGLVLYSARSHYGEEEPFERFAKATGTDLTLRGGSASELYERLRSEGSNTPADVLITVDAANLWRAKEAGLIDSWKPLTLRARTIMRSTERTEPTDVTTYEGLGDPRWKGKLCLRSGTSEYNVSFVADRLAKDGRPATERMLRRWLANDPTILGSDTDVLEAIADGDCDVGFTNTYYLGRELAEKPDFPVAPVWADQQGRGTHVNLSGIGVVHVSDHADEARKLIEYLREPLQQEEFAQNNHEYPVVAGAKPSKEIGQFGTFKRDMIDVDGAGAHLDEALKLMDQVGWD
ncbi:MAG: iron(III) transport system substrate-binding protein [Thermoleophilaceae bacterium]|jgi:iron(III) transport system substrate-binding protein|nr:iron(III) transport system substrate-binding protein [Thermoleophilaceae bacterium]